MAVPLLAAATATGATGCSYLGILGELSRNQELGEPIEVWRYELSARHAQPRFRAGAAVEDITPPPGYPTGGYGPLGAVARGYWMRLQARAFFFEDRDGRVLALVSADLFAAPSGLRAMVAKLASDEMERRGLDVHLPPEALVLAATHTHHGPGNYLSSRAYNQFASAYNGFSRELFDFLAGRIARAVVRAAENARSHAETIEIAVHVGRVGHDLVRNRSPRAFMLNRDRDALLGALGEGDPPPRCEPGELEPREMWTLPGCPRLAAADRALTVLEVSRTGAAGSRLAAALVFFAVHPTVLEPSAPLFSPDFTGYAVRALERRWSGRGEPVVVGFFNGAEGDVVARRAARDLRDVMRLGDVFAKRVAEVRSAHPGRVLRDPLVTVRSREWRPSRAEDRVCRWAGGEALLAGGPVPGAAMLGGAEGDTSPLHDLGWREGVRDRPLGAQGPKLPALDSPLVRALRFTGNFAPPDAFPDALPLAVAAVGDFQLAAIPVEATTAEGQAIRAALGRPHGQLELVGLANEYGSYCSSADEYPAQDYVGASTLWGRDEGPWIACRLAEVARAAEPPPTRRAGERAFWPGAAPLHPFGPQFAGVVTRPDEGLEQVLLNEAGLPERRLPWFAWDEPGSVAGCFHPPARRVTVWRDESGGWREYRPEAGGPPEDDAGPGFLTVHLGAGRWAAVWVRPLRGAQAGRYAFVVEAGGALFCSRSFELAPGTQGPDRIEAAPGCGDYGTGRTALDASGAPGSSLP